MNNNTAREVRSVNDGIFGNNVNDGCKIPHFEPGWNLRPARVTGGVTFASLRGDTPPNRFGPGCLHTSGHFKSDYRSFLLEH